MSANTIVNPAAILASTPVGRGLIASDAIAANQLIVHDEHPVARVPFRYKDSLFNFICFLKC